MLAHFENLDFSPLLVHFNRLHVCLLHGLDCHLSLGDFVLSQLDHTKLTFAKDFAKLIEVEQIDEATGFDQMFVPLIGYLLGIEVKDS